jgi:Putative prokaryotic signal transducing protein
VFSNIYKIEEIIMSEENWEVVYETNGALEAEILRGLLEANEIRVFLSQEGLGRVYGLTVGALGVVQILVPHSQAQLARSLLQDYASGKPLDDSEQDLTGSSEKPETDE